MKTIETKQLAEVLLDMTDGKPDTEIKKSLKEFAAFLFKKGKLSETDTILGEYRKLYNKKHNIVEATVTLTERLPENTRLKLREALKKKYKAREVHMLEKVDARLIGGMKIRIEDEVYDASIQNSLKQLQAQLEK